MNTPPKELSTQSTWLVTGCAGFIGSNLLEFLLLNNQRVIGLDNFRTGKKENLLDVKSAVGNAWDQFSFIEGDICSFETCQKAVEDVHYVLHQAALGSVPGSIADPVQWNNINVSGFVNMITAAKNASVKGFVYASSSSVYGDGKDLPKVENKIGSPLSPYAVSKLTNELYGDVFASCYGFSSIGLRYFNVFGKRQDPHGAYAAVMPRWISSMAKGEETFINGDGTTSRDFCYINNVIQANILAALQQSSDSPLHQVFNVGVSETTSLIELHALLKTQVEKTLDIKVPEPKFRAFREGDIKHSLASIDAIKLKLGYVPTHTIREGIGECAGWYLKNY